MFDIYKHHRTNISIFNNVFTLKNITLNKPTITTNILINLTSNFKKKKVKKRHIQKFITRKLKNETSINIFEE